MPSWKYLLLYTLVVVVLALPQTTENVLKDADGPGGMVAYMICGMVLWSAIFGIAAKSVSLFLKHRKFSPTKTRIPLYAGYPVMLALTFGIMPLVFKAFQHE